MRNGRAGLIEYRRLVYTSHSSRDTDRANIAAHERKSVKAFLVGLAQARLEELEKKGILPKGK